MPAAETLYPRIVKSFLDYINFFANKITNEEEIKIKKNLNEVKGMLDVREKNKEIWYSLKLSHDNGIKNCRTLKSRQQTIFESVAKQRA